MPLTHKRLPKRYVATVHLRKHHRVLPERIKQGSEYQKTNKISNQKESKNKLKSPFERHTSGFLSCMPIQQ
jgi:hypothetical protein